MKFTFLAAALISNIQRSQAYVSRLRSKPSMKVRPKYVLSTDQIESFVNGNETDDISTALGQQQCNRPRLRKRWGIDNEYREEYWMTEYWFDNRIHTLGNMYVSCIILMISPDLDEECAYSHTLVYSRF